MLGLVQKMYRIKIRALSVQTNNQIADFSMGYLARYSTQNYLYEEFRYNIMSVYSIDYR